MTAPAECRLKESYVKDENEHHRYYDKDNKTICLKIILGIGTYLILTTHSHTHCIYTFQLYIIIAGLILY